jgi:DNA ligase-1
MRALAEVGEKIRGTPKKSEKVAFLADYFRSRPIEEAAISAVFLSGKAFPAFEETTLNVGGTMLWKLIAELAPGGAPAVAEGYKKFGDLGDAAEEALAGAAAAESELGVLDVEAAFRAISRARGPAAKKKLLSELFARATAVETKYLVKVIGGDLRIGLKESLVLEAIAKAFEAEATAVQRAAMLLGDVGETLRLAAGGRLGEARLRLFHPLGFMLASPVEDAEEALSGFADARVEDKYDGIRAQAHCGGGESAGKVKIFSRTLDDVTDSFPELALALGDLEDVILDGEILAWRGDEGGRALPFSELQKRLGRKAVADATMRAVPVAYVAFDVLYAGGEALFDRPLRERAEALDRALAARRARPRAAGGGRKQLSFLFGGEAEESPKGAVIRAPVAKASSPEELTGLFQAARARGNEGLMIKDPSSAYAPGSRGRSWLKLKEELATLDVVVTAVEQGHGKRAKVLSDYTFAVRDGERLVTIGKAYSGLTDAEIAELSAYFKEHTVLDEGFRREVTPLLVIEVAFNNVMRSDRHESGYALRFPRIVRVRRDKPPEEIDSLEKVRAIFERQAALGSGEAE